MWADSVCTRADPGLHYGASALPSGETCSTHDLQVTWPDTRFWEASPLPKRTDGLALPPPQASQKGRRKAHHTDLLTSHCPPTLVGESSLSPPWAGTPLRGWVGPLLASAGVARPGRCWLDSKTRGLCSPSPCWGVGWGWVGSEAEQVSSQGNLKVWARQPSVLSLYSSEESRKESPLWDRQEGSCHQGSQHKALIHGQVWAEPGRAWGCTAGGLELLILALPRPDLSVTQLLLCTDGLPREPGGGDGYHIKLLKEIKCHSFGVSSPKGGPGNSMATVTPTARVWTALDLF